MGEVYQARDQPRSTGTWRSRCCHVAFAVDPDRPALASRIEAACCREAERMLAA